ncbi:sensor histidine kinase [Candidatus Enterococcus clewellii]|uniref:Two-component system, sensor histidine kinase YesM n=1 Tax=Candidatus Enterococcus clewellii TaxID=1834193 RepID=A0A242KDN4_9ENTE|nr:histidine kinase [Enterococcus sp. 9E7_DIV0242]OTP18898.1 hypothetical protein A5888_000712 [Enterococcus sp. 9E7_DIV0242]
MSINRQLRFSTFFITGFALLLISLLSYWTFFQSSYNELKANTINSLNRSASTIEQRINELDILTEKAQFFSKNSYDLMSDLRKYAVGSDFSNEELFNSEQEIKGIFRTLIYRMDQLNFLAIALPNGRIISYSNTQKDFSYGYDPLQAQWYQQALAAKGALNISAIEDESIIVNGGEERTLLFSRAIYDFYSKEFLGIFVVNCEPSFFDFISKDFPDKISGFQLMDKQNDTIFYEANPMVDTQPKDMVSKTINANRQPLKLSVSVDNQEYVQLLWTTLRNMALIFIGILLLSLLISYRFANLFTAPIVKLSKIMRQRSQEDIIFDTQDDEQRNDEIGILYQEYQQMLRAIKQYTQEQINFEQSLLKSELNVYKNQIDSHFLYNTLESINSLAEIEEIDEISTMTLSLSNMFRYASNGFVNEATLADELHNVEDYLNIQEIRFQKKIDYLVINNSDNLLQAHIPKVIIQPLVENAIYHGLSKGGIDGKIRLFISKTKNTVLIRVYDDGLGMDEYTLAQITNNLADATDIVRKRTNHIGLINIEARIKNTYGNDYGLAIFSKPGQGTFVELRLPILLKGENDV